MRGSTNSCDHFGHLQADHFGRLHRDQFGYLHRDHLAHPVTNAATNPRSPGPVSIVATPGAARAVRMHSANFVDHEMVYLF